MTNLKRENSLLNLGSHITNLRKIRGISLEKLAYECGISKGNLSDIENGKKNPTFLTLLAISDGLEITLKDFFEDFQLPE